jgi:hypothetical protein
MRRDNVASPTLPGLTELGIAPTSLEDVVATLMSQRTASPN